MRLRLLLLGSLPPPAGGTTLLFRQLAEGLAGRDDLRVRVVDTGARSLLGRTGAIVRALAAIPRCDVASFHASPPGLAAVAPLLSLVCRALGKPLVLRAFGGNLDLALAELPPRARSRLVRALERAACVLVETDQLAAWLRERHPRARVAIYRNNRPLAAPPPSLPPGARRFVFLGTVCEEKGAGELAEAMQAIAGSGFALDVHGPTPDPELRARLEAAPGVRVLGPLAPSRVAAALAEADALVLPTRHAGEGHPGVVIEAFSAGRPVVATRWRAIPELVQHERNGLLVPVADPAALGAAMRRLATESGLAARLGAAAFVTARDFAAERWTERFVEVCRAAAASRPERRLR